MTLIGVAKDGDSPRKSPIVQPFSIPAGESGTIGLIVYHADGTAFDLTSCQLLLAVNGTTISRQGTITTPASLGLASFPLVIADTLNMRPADYTFDVWLTDANGNRWQVVPASKWTVLPFQGQPGQAVTVPSTQQPLALGPPGVNWRGTYNSGTAYAPLDAVSYTDPSTAAVSSYRCIANTTGNAPTNATYWVLMAQGQGITGVVQSPPATPLGPSGVITFDGTQLSAQKNNTTGAIDVTAPGLVPKTRNITAGTGLAGGCTGLAADCAFAAAFGSALGTIAQGNDARFPPAPGTAGNFVVDNTSGYTSRQLAYADLTSPGLVGAVAGTVAPGNDERMALDAIAQYGVSAAASDNAAALNNCLTAAHSDTTRRTCQLPAGTFKIASTITVPSGVTLLGAATGTVIAYTPATGTAITFGSGGSSVLRNLEVRATNAAYSGSLVTASQNTLLFDSVGFRCQSSGGTCTGAAALLDLTNSVNVTLTGRGFFWGAQKCLVGVNSGGGFSNVVSVTGQVFNYCEQYAIYQPAYNWNVDNCTFEPTTLGYPSGIYMTATVAKGLKVSNSYFSDASAANAGNNWIDLLCQGCDISNGNTFVNGYSVGMAYPLTNIGGEIFETGSRGISFDANYVLGADALSFPACTANSLMTSQASAQEYHAAGNTLLKLSDGTAFAGPNSCVGGIQAYLGNFTNINVQNLTPTGAFTATGAFTTLGSSASMNIRSRWSLAQTTVADANYTLALQDTTVSYTSISAARVISANPSATGNSISPRIFIVQDTSGSASSTNTISLTPTSGTINGASTLVLIDRAYGRAIVFCDGTNFWTAPEVDQPAAGTGLSSSLSGHITTLSMPNTGPGATTTGGGGTYIASVQTDAQGRIVALTTGTPTGSGTVSSVTCGTGLTGGTFTTTGTCAIDYTVGWAGTAAGSVAVASVGTASTAGWTVKNTTAAANGAQQYSPALVLDGRGWASTGGTSQDDSFAIQAQPVQGTSNSTANLVFLASINGGSYAAEMTLTSAGSLSLAASGTLTAQTLQQNSGQLNVCTGLTTTCSISIAGTTHATTVNGPLVSAQGWAPAHRAASSTVAVAVSDRTVGVTGTGSRTVNFPAASTCVHAGQEIVVVEEGGSSGTITINPNGTDNFNGANSAVTIAAAYGRRVFVCDASANWFVSTVQ